MNVPGNSNTFVSAGRLALSDTVFIIVVITGPALSSFCRSLHCLETLYVHYYHHSWSFRALLGVFGTLRCVFWGIKEKTFAQHFDPSELQLYRWWCIFLTW